MAPTGLHRSCWGGALAIVCALTVIGCASTPAHRSASARGDGSTARLTPDPAYAAARIAVVFGESALDRSTCSYEWRRNGFVIDGASRSELEPSMFAKGDRVSVRIGAPATPGGEARTLTAEVRVANSPPRIAGVGLVMVVAPAGAEVQAKVDCTDLDGDSPKLEYEWSRNGALIKGARGASLSASGLARGDRVTVAVVARDDESASPPVDSEPCVLENHPPSFSSQPGAPRPADAMFEYQAMAQDADGDPLRYELVQAPVGMTVGPQGDVRWELPAGEQRHGEYPVRIRAMDANGGEAVQAFTIQLDAVPPAR
jgi:hypothetical protein